MRITNQYKFSKSVFEYQRSQTNINKFNTQLSSGLKIEHSYESASIYNDGMRLDYEINTLTQIETSTSKSLSFTNNSDRALVEFGKQLENFKTKLVQSANSVHSKTSREALAKELEGIKDHLKNIANTSINGQFLFSGSATDTKPIDNLGVYSGNNEYMKTTGGSQIELPFNIPGSEIFLGKDNDYNKILSTNLSLVDNTQKDAKDNPKFLNENSTIKQMVGLNYVKNAGDLNVDHDFLENGGKEFPKTYFYLSGKKPNGVSFNSKFSMDANTNLKTLLDKIGLEFGNTTNSKVVDISMNNSGQIVVKDLSDGSSLLNFKLLAATPKADSLTNLQRFADIDRGRIQGTATTPVPKSNADKLTYDALKLQADKDAIHITEFTKNNFKNLNGESVNPFDYDRVRFPKKDNKLFSTVSQIVRHNGEFATDETKLSEVVATNGGYKGVKDLFNINDRNLEMDVRAINGKHYKVDLNLGVRPHQGNIPAARSVSFTVREIDDAKKAPNNTTMIGTYNVRHADEFGNYETSATDFTYRQLNDIIGMVSSNTLPANNNFQGYSEAISKSKGLVEANMDNRGKIEILDKTKSTSNLEFAMYDISEYNNINAGLKYNHSQFWGDSTGTDFFTSQGQSATFSFVENNAVTIDEPSVDIFKDLDNMIKSVRDGNYRADGNSDDPRNTGIQGAIARLDHIIDHVNKQKTQIGSQTNLIEEVKDRATLMKVNVSEVKSKIIDTDYAESFLFLNQQIFSYQAMLQSSARINQLSLLNYLN